MNRSKSRIELAVICDSVPPYRAHLHRTLVAGFPQIKFWTVVTHDEDSRWNPAAGAEIGLISVSSGVPCAEHGPTRHILAEWRTAGRVIDFLRKHEIRAVISLGYNDVGKLRILRWCRANRVPCFIWGDSNIRDDRGTGLRAWIKKAILTRLLPKYTAVMTCGSLGDAYFEKYGVSRNRMFLLPYMPDYGLIRDMSRERIAAVRDRFHLNPKRRRIIYSGRLIARKRVDQLIDAFAALAVDRPEWDLVIVGDGPMCEMYKSRVPDHLRERVLWGGHLKETGDIAALYHCCDILVLPSEQEPWALVINEACAAGLAVVCSSVVGAGAELVRDGINGRVFPAGDLTALTDALIEVTSAECIDALKASSAGILDDWIRRSDPVINVRRALAIAGIDVTADGQQAPVI
jgi:glycosyltransferase involved in cell wall biosynthesis